MTLPALQSIDTVVSEVEQIHTTAERINALHAAAAEASSTALECARRCGELLQFAKEQMPHGKWLPWLRENTTVSERTAQRYMWLASHWDEIRAKNPTHVSEMSLRGAMQSVCGSLPRPAEDETTFVPDEMLRVLEKLITRINNITYRLNIEDLPQVAARLRIIADQLDMRVQNEAGA